MSDLASSIGKLWLPHEADLWVTGTLQKNEGGFAIFQADLANGGGEIIKISEKEAANLPKVEPDQLTGVDDICSLADVSEAALLHTVRVRYAAKKIYTNVARTLIAVNPFSAMNIYSADYLAQYIPSAKADSLPPHIYGIGQDAIRGLRETSRNQAVLVSGESGAGKTESAKLIMSYVAAAMRSDSQSCMDNVLRSNIILESFGNAMTVRNNNSSRFGKWLDLHFSKALESSGATVTSFLLETPRVIHQGPKERGYHVFFQLMQAKGEFPELKLEDPTKYNYVKDSQHKAPGIDDAEEFGQLKDGFHSFGIGGTTQKEIWTLLASILTLGNVEFKAVGEGSDVVQAEPLERVAALLKVDAKELKSLLTIRKIVVGSEVTEAVNRFDAAAGVRDGLARLLYGKLFLWIIEQLNATLACGGESTAGDRLLGVLDIAGFECFEHNSLEQLCINLSNEHLQQHFNISMIKSETEECQKEGVKMPDIEGFFDNERILSLIDNKGGIMDLLDETCFTNFAGTTDMTYANKVVKMHGSHENLIAPKAQIKPIFGIKHFAGDVTYGCEEWLQKNLEKMPLDTAGLLQSSGLGVVRAIGKSLVEADSAAAKKVMKSVTSSFRKSLKELMSKIHAAQPHYIRCIKPNMEKLPGRFTAPAVMQQLLFGGVLAAVNIRQRGFAYRLSHHDFVSLYGCITDRLLSELTKEERSKMEDYNKKQIQAVQKTTSPPDSRAAKVLVVLPGILAAIGFEMEADTFALGSTKFFAKDAARKALDAGRNRALRGMASKIQRIWRGILARRRCRAIKQLRSELLVILARVNLGEPSENKRSKRKTSNASSSGGKSMMELLGSRHEMKEVSADLGVLLTQADSLEVDHSCIDEADWVQRRLGAEISTVKETKTLNKSLDIMKIQANLAMARNRFHMADFPELVRLDKRLESLTLQVPLVTAMERVLAERASKPDGYLEKLKAALKPIDEALIQKSNKWLPELPGSKLYLKVMQVTVEVMALTDKAGSEKLAEALKVAEQLAKEHDIINKEAARVEAEQRAQRKAVRAAEKAAKEAKKRAEEAAKMLRGNKAFAELLAKELTQIQEIFKETSERQCLVAEKDIAKALAAEQAKEAGEKEKVKAQQTADSIETKLKLKLEAQRLKVELDFQRRSQEVGDRVAASKKEKELTQQLQDEYNTCEQEYQQKLSNVLAQAVQVLAQRMKMWRLMVPPGGKSEVEHVSGIVAKAHDEYDVEALDVYLGYAADCGLEDPMEGGPLKAAALFFSQVQTDAKVDEMLDDLTIEVDEKPSFELLLRFMNLSDHNRNIQGFCKADHLRALETGISAYAKAKGLQSMFDSTSPEEIEMAYNVFGNRRNFATLKMASTWGAQGAATFTKSQRKTLRRQKTGVQQQGLFAGNPSASDAKVQAEAFDVMLSYSFKKNTGESAIVESLLVPPESESVDAEKFNSEATLNFINIASWMGDRPVSQRQGCHDAILNLAADMIYRDEVYIQVMKQLTGNTRPFSLKAGWILLHHLLASAPPSPTMGEFLRAFATDALDELSENPETAEWGTNVATIALDSLKGKSKWRRVDDRWEAVTESVWWTVEVKA